MQRGILKNTNPQQIIVDKPKQTRKEKLLDQYNRDRDEDYYQNNNIVFTGTFNNDEDDISDISAMTIIQDRRNGQQ